VAPDFPLRYPDGTEGRLSDLRRTDVLLVFGKTTCPHTMNKIAPLNKLAEHDPDGEAFKVIFIPVREDPARLRDFVARHQAKFDVIHDSTGSVAALYGVTRFPSAFWIDDKGVVSYSANQDGQAIWQTLGQTEDATTPADAPNSTNSGGLVIAFGLGVFSNASTVKAAGPELCNSIDDDGDGYIDEYNDPVLGVPRYKGQGCYGIGECGIGKVECKSGTNIVDCWTNPGGSYEENTTEICDNLDNDCDGLQDDDFPYFDPILGENRYTGQGCYGIGECGIGKVECFNPFTASCWTNPGGSREENTSEVCNNLDDDCDGQTDEDGVCKVVSITLYGYPITFGSLNPGSLDNPALGNAGNSYNISVDDETTTDVDLWIKGTDFVSGGEALEIGNMTFSAVNNPSGSVQITDDWTIITSEIPSGTNVTLYFWLDIPAGQETASYSANIDIKAVEPGGMGASDTVSSGAFMSVMCDPEPELCNGIDDDCDGEIDEDFNDVDTDGVADCVDNCPDDSNADQLDSDADGAGEICDNCPDTFNLSQADVDEDGIGNACDADCPNLDGLNPVDANDFAVFAGYWGASGPDLPADLDFDQTVDANDLAIFSTYWLADCYEEAGQ
jgi:peroxiredoxin